MFESQKIYCINYTVAAYCKEFDAQRTKRAHVQSEDNRGTSLPTYRINGYCNIQSTLVISKSKGLSGILRDIRTSTYQSRESEEKNKLNNHI